ncbi:hypothetical protein DFH08DRAFT_688844 [Mycena albidolilacea]|uniref:BTB domain-containing protein n=1 Tax=Mycena albidolilacea TaxID=1033008 RepID=A0AAD7AFB7_9AGAR|nr:hypothetical protein DFH08DRAFT_688844 [Mycena albidolilacea]
MSELAVYSAPSRNRDFWFPDGDIVLSCPQPHGRRCLFRVHKFMLTQHSLPFAEMIKKEALLSVLETLDGLPVVLLPEPASEIHKLLCCLYNALNGGAFNDEERPITRYDWLLRICSKYKILPLHKRIVAQLKAEWPATLPAWDAREAHIAALLQQHIAAGPPGRVHDMYLDDRLAEPVLTIHTARALSLPQLLPAAFYDLARRDPRADWDALHTDAAARALPANERLLVGGVRSARWGALCAHDLLVLAALKETLATLVREGWEMMRRAQIPHAVCDAARKDVLERSKELAVVSRDPLYAAQWACQYTTKAGMCKSCETNLVRWLATFRVSCWLTLLQKFQHRN